MPSSDPQPRDPLVGARIDNRYTVRGTLGRGGMGVVYDGVHDELGRSVAIKVLNAAWAADPLAVERFLREARTAGSLSHGNIVDVSDLGRLPDGRPYLVMPKISGTDLAELLRNAGRQPPKRVAELLTGVGAALDLIHAKGLVHRDIKPENLMYVVREDGSETVMLLDFGIAALVASNEPRLTRQGAIFGTPEYLPPEVWDGKLPDGRGDVYALATVAFELMTGELPFVAQNVMQILPLKLKADAPRMSHVSGVNFPDVIEYVVARGLAREPNDRYRAASEFVNALRGATATAPISWRPGDIEAPRAGPRADSGAALEEPLLPTSDSAVLAISAHEDSKTFLDVPKPSSDSPPTLAEHQQAPAFAAVRAPSANDALDSTELEALIARPTQRGSTQLPASTTRRFLPHAAALAVALLALIVWLDSRPEAPKSVAPVHEVKPAPTPPASTAAPQAIETTPAAPTEPEPVPEPARAAAIEPIATPTPSAPIIARKPKPESEPSPSPASTIEPIVQAPIAPPVTERPTAPPPKPVAHPAVPAKPAPVAAPAKKPTRDPALAAQLTHEGTTALLSGQVAHAAELLNRAIAADPGHAPAYRSLGLALERAGKNADAIASYQKYLLLEPNGAQADKVRERVHALE